ncbi:MAG: hypothetical protein Q9206_001413 [Seirophora lacunosa]
MSNTLFMHPALRLWLEMLSLSMDPHRNLMGKQAVPQRLKASRPGFVCSKKVPRIDRLPTAGSFPDGAIFEGNNRKDDDDGILMFRRIMSSNVVDYLSQTRTPMQSDLTGVFFKGTSPTIRIQPRRPPAASQAAHIQQRDWGPFPFGQRQHNLPSCRYRLERIPSSPHPHPVADGIEGARSAKQEPRATTATSIRSVWPNYLAAPRRSEPPAPFPLSTYKLPSLDISQAQAAQAGHQYWPGATASAPSLAYPPSHTLPTPPTTESDVFKPPSENRNDGFNLAAAAPQQQPSMASTLEPHGQPQSLTARRSAASNLPTFELPPPPSISQKFMQYNNVPVTQSTPAMVSVGNLLTPPTNIPGDSLSPLPSTMNNHGNGSQNLQSYAPPGAFWPPPAGANNSYPLGGTPQPFNQGSGSLFPPRGMFSPSLNSLVRNNSNSPSSTDGLPPPPPFDMHQLPPFPGSMPMSAPPNPSTVGSVGAPQYQAYTPQNYMNAHSPGSAPTTQASPVNGPDYRPHSTPTYYAGSQASSTPQSSHFPQFQNHSPPQNSPLTASAPQGSRTSPLNGQSSGSQHPVQQPGSGFPRHYPLYNLPAISGPIITNMQTPGGQMTMLGMPNHGLPGNIMPGYNSGASAQMHQLYAGHHQPAPHNDRPFKCDQCPQSFNRNHDLKRHKRIHLAVKPFPCGHCDKSFSRKDALKRHILVKNCGKSPSRSARDRESMSPVEKSEAQSSDNDDSPVKFDG